MMTEGHEHKRKEFGKLVDQLMKECSMSNGVVSSDLIIPWHLQQQITNPWTPEYLAYRSGIKLRAIRSILRGEKVKLEPYLAPLAKAFNLTESQKVDFYATAGYLYEPAHPFTCDFEVMSLHIEAKAYPATLHTGLWDFVFINPLYATLHGITPDVINTLYKSSLGPNLLLLLFDPQFMDTNTTNRIHGWDVLAIRSFRRSAFRYKSTDRYNTIINYMQRLPAFCKAWENSYEDEHVMNIRDNFGWSFSVRHPEFGLMRFNSYREDSEDTSPNISMVYAPDGDSMQNYIEFRNSVRARKPIKFCPPPLYNPPLDSNNKSTTDNSKA